MLCTEEQSEKNIHMPTRMHAHKQARARTRTHACQRTHIADY